MTRRDKIPKKTTVHVTVKGVLWDALFAYAEVVDALVRPRQLQLPMWCDYMHCTEADRSVSGRFCSTRCRFLEVAYEEGGLCQIPMKGG